MGLLADAFSYGNGLKRKVNGLLADPVGTLELGVNRLGEDQNKLLALMKDVMPAGRYVAPEVRKNALKELADYGSQVGMAGATVWHGSPHKFDKFDSSKIGTGEGAQAYGHGLYLAESPDVATMYRDKLTDPQRAAALRAQVETLKDPAGALYKVDLPDEHIAKMLDWDKPLSQQSPEVKAAIGLDKNPNASIKDMTGLEFYVGTGGKLGNPTSSSKEAAAHLAKKGITGIRYLDQGSRSAGQGTSNFVVFPGNESLLQILERNGQPVNALQGLLAP